MGDDEIVDFYIQEGVEAITKSSKQAKAFMGTIRESPTKSRNSVVSTNSNNKSISDTLEEPGESSPSKRGSVLNNKGGTKGKFRLGKSQTSRKSLLLKSVPNEDIESALKDVYDEQAADEVVIVNILKTLGDDITILNEQSFIPPLNQMLKLMIPADKRKLKDVKKPRSKKLK